MGGGGRKRYWESWWERGWERRWEGWEGVRGDGCGTYEDMSVAMTRTCLSFS